VIIALPLAVICLLHRFGCANDEAVFECIAQAKEWMCTSLCCRAAPPPPIAAAARAQSLAAAATSRPSTASRIAVALTQMALYTFSAVAAALFRLLQCTHIDQSMQPYLLIAPDVACYQPWQGWLFLLLVLVLASPIALALFTCRQVQPRTVVNGPGGGHSVWILLTDPFASHAVYWESVQLLWRLLVIVVYTFAPRPVDRILTLMALTLGLLCLHLQWRPMREPATQQFNTLTLLFLTLMGALNLPTATTAQNASLARPALSSSLLGTQAVQTVLLLLPIAIGGALVLRRLACRDQSRPSHVHEHLQSDAVSDHFIALVDRS
jgi:hypothetical protein